MEVIERNKKMEGLLWIWHVSTENHKDLKYLDYDTFSDFIIVAKTEQEARTTHPYGSVDESEETKQLRWDPLYNMTWVKREHLPLLTVTCLGLCTNPKYVSRQIICASFHAG